MTAAATVLGCYFLFVVLPGAVLVWEQTEAHEYDGHPARAVLASIFRAVFAWPVYLLLFCAEDALRGPRK